jgi:hypothetical protein
VLAKRITCCIVAGALLGLTSRVAPAQSVGRWLQETGLSEKELAKLDSGEPLVWVPKADDATEVTLLAVARIAASPTRLTGMVRDVLGLAQRNDQVMQVGMFSTDPVVADASQLRLPDGDVKDLGKCKPGSCNLKFPAEALNAVQDQVASAEQANRFMAEWLASYLSAYQQRGREALAVYAEKKEPQSVAEGLDILLRKTDLLLEYDEDFYRYVRQYPNDESAGAENLFYWTVEDLSLKPTVFLNHMSIRGGEGPDMLVVVKQIYASHYMQAGVKAYAVMPVSDTDPSQGVYVLFTQRLRFDGEVKGIKRSTLESGTKKAASAQLRSFKAYAEAAG